MTDPTDTLPPTNMKYNSARCARIPKLFEALGTTQKEKNTLRTIGTVVANICDDVAGLVRTLRGVNSHDGLLNRVTGIEERQDAILTKMDELTEAVKSLEVKVDRRRATDTPKKKYLTLEGIALLLLKYVFQPIIIAVVIWLLTKFMPDLLGKL